MIVFLDVEDVKLIHAEQIDAFGGSHGVRDEGSLESAVNQAQATFGEEYLHSFPFGMASAYAFHIAQNQPFVDGNKRAALAAALVFRGQRTRDLCGRRTIVRSDDRDCGETSIKARSG